MACATLKRPLEFDPLHSPNPTKRQRCMPMCISPSNSPPRNLSSPPRPNSSSPYAMFNPNSPFVTRVSKLTPDMIANGIFEEMKRLHRRKELHIPQHHYHQNTQSTSTQQQQQQSCSTAQQQSSSSTATVTASPTCSQSIITPTNNDDRDKPIFTFRHVEYICSKMLAEQEYKLKLEYDEILNEKLKEQFDIFNKFSVDQIDRLARHNTQTPSYLS